MENTQVTVSELMPNGYVASSAVMNEIFPAIKAKKFKSYLRARNIALGVNATDRRGKKGANSRQHH